MTGPAYFSLWTDDKIPGATLGMTNADADFPVANAQNDDPADTAKATGTSTVVTITLDAIYQIVAYMVANTNATSIALGNGAGMASQAVTVPTRTADGQIINGWKNMTGVANTTDNDWSLTMSKTGSAVLEFGRIVLVAALRDVGFTVVGRDGPMRGIRRPGFVEHRARGGTLHRRPVGTQYQVMSGRILRDSYLATHLALSAGAGGLGQGFFFVPDGLVNEAWFATVVDPTQSNWQHLHRLVSAVDVGIEELCMGAPPALA